MGLPKFPDSSDILSREKAIDAILTSIAMEETALSHIITAESEKIQFAINQAKNKPECDLCSVLKVNKSVESVLDKVNDMQILLKNKLRIAANFVPVPGPPSVSVPPGPPNPPAVPVPPVLPTPPQTTVFTVPKGHCWGEGLTLNLEMQNYRHNNVKPGTVDCNRVILLPPGKTFKITLELDMKNYSDCPASVKMALGHGHRLDECIVHAKEFYQNGKAQHFFIKDTQVWATTGQWKEHFLAISLKMPEIIKVLSGKVLIAEHN